MSHSFSRNAKNGNGKAQFELGISLVLFNWTALRLAVQNGWGGPESEDKRDWLAGAVWELFEKEDNLPAMFDVEDLLQQVMQDEFEVILEDDSAIQIAGEIIRIYEECSVGDFKSVLTLFESFQKDKEKVDLVSFNQNKSDGSEDSDESGSDVDMESGEDMEPGNRPMSASRKIVDDEGFELVQGRR